MSSRKKLAVAVIGLGFGAKHARVLSELENVQLVAVCDTDEQRLAAVADGRSIGAFNDYSTMLHEVALDAVIVAVPARLHEPVARAAIDAGCAVLVEKPLAPSLREGHCLALAAAAAGVPLMAGHIERFNPAVQELARRVQAGEIGRVLHVSARRMAPIVPRTQDVGIVHDSALHDIDVMRYVLGREVERVHAEAQTGVLMPFEDSIAAVLRFGSADGSAGAIGSLEVNWLSPRRQRELVVLGEQGLFVLDYAAQTLELFQAKATSQPDEPVPVWSPAQAGAGDEAIRIPVEPREPLKLELKAFLSAVSTGQPMPVTGADALATLAVADALTQSARTGQPVTPVRE